MIAVGIITAPRARPTLMKSLRALRSAGFEQTVHVFAEPGSDTLIMDDVRYIHHEERKGNFHNWVFALESLLLLDDDWLMICEDDISWAVNASSVIEHDLSKCDVGGNSGALSLYCPIKMSKVLEKEYANGGRLKPGWYGARLGRKTWGAQCLVLHRLWAHMLLADKVFLEFLADPKWDKNVDALVAETINRRGREIVYRIPCLVDHTFGDGNSSLGYPADRPELKTSYFKDR